MIDDKLEKTIDVLSGVNLVVNVQGEQFNIRHFRYLESIKIVKLLKKYSNSIPWQLFELNADSDIEKMTSMIIECIEDCGEALLEIIKLHLNKDDKWAELLEIDEVVNLIMAIFKANADFFVKTLLPLIPNMQPNSANKK